MSGARSFKFLVAMILAVAIPALASNELSSEASCTPVDLREKYPFLATADDQGKGPSACFAWGVASLVSAKLGREVSANGIFHAFEASAGGRFWRLLASVGGNPEWAIKAAQKSGFCTEEALRSWNRKWGPETEYRMVDLWDTLAALKKLSENLSSTPAEHRPCVARERVGEVRNLRLIFPKVPLDEIVNILASVAPDEVVHRMIEVNCEKDRIEADFKVVGNWGMTSSFVEEAKTEVDAQLSVQNPIAIGNRALLLKSLDKSKPGQLPRILLEWMGERYFDAHVSTVIGRRLNPGSGKCEYLVRNSWGPACYNYSNRIGNDPDRCLNGVLWISGDLLFPRAYMTLYLE